jgi:small-conductance mechanosensitive channel
MVINPGDALNIFGVTLIGATPENGRRLLLTVAFVAVVLLMGRAMRWIISRLNRGIRNRRPAFWSRQAVNIGVAVLLVLGVLSVWFDDPTRLTTALGLVTAGLAFALQRVVTAIAGYVIILRGDTFNLGDRIVMSGVRGDVIGLSFMQTTILEMGEPASVTLASAPSSSTWIHSRQYTGRIVTVSNAKVFDEPVYNYTRDFPYLWEEMSLPIRYGSEVDTAEKILLAAAVKHTGPIVQLGAEEAAALQRRYQLPTAGTEPRVYVRLTTSWLEVTVRFLTRTHGVRELKSAISREILKEFEAAGIHIATNTYEIVGNTTVRIDTQDIK